MAKSNMNKYSLSNYTVKVIFPNYDGSDIIYPTSGDNTGLPVVSFGGEGDYLGEVSVERRTDLWSIDADATGAYVFNQNLDKTGTVKISVKQVSDKIMNLYYYGTSIFEDENLQGGAYIAIQRDGTTLVECEDCMITKLPNLPFQKDAQQMDWSFLCGKISFTSNFTKMSTETEE